MIDVVICALPSLYKLEKEGLGGEYWWAVPGRPDDMGSAGEAIAAAPRH